MKTTKIGVHHSGPMSPTDPYSSSRNLSEAVINSSHKARDFNLSQMGFYIGYNVVIYPDGSWKQYRLLGEQTAAATGSNFDTFHFCLIGNFTMAGRDNVDVPTTKQIATLTQLMRALLDGRPESVGIKTVGGQEFAFTAYNVFPHRVLQPNHTSCYGDLLPDNWARNIAFDYLKEQNKSNAVLFKILCLITDYFNARKLGRIKPLAGVTDFSDEGIIYNP